jgi:hypothetical protein
VPSLPDIEEAAYGSGLFQLLKRCPSAADPIRSRVDNMAEARERAAIVVHSLISAPGPVDWRSWVLHARDDLGEEIFALPFSSIIGRLH